MTEIGQTQMDIHAWANGQFPERTPRTIIAKIIEEISELVLEPYDAEEIADVMILLMDLASMVGVDVHVAVALKMAKNRSRRWVPNGDGTYSHIKEEQHGLT